MLRHDACVCAEGAEGNARWVVGVGGLAQVCEARVSRFPGSGYKMKLVESEGESNQIF